jgi:hypothetical protein
MDEVVVMWRRGRAINGKKTIWGAVAVGTDHQPPHEGDLGERRDTFCVYSFEVEREHADLYGELTAVQKTLHEIADAFSAKIKQKGCADGILGGTMKYGGIQWRVNIHEGGIKTTRIAA